MAGQILEILGYLSKDELERFKFHLNYQVLKVCKPIPRGQLEDKSRTDVVILMEKFYHNKIVNVTRKILKMISRNDLVQRLKSNPGKNAVPITACRKPKAKRTERKHALNPKQKLKNLKKENKKTQISNQRNKNLKCKIKSDAVPTTAHGQPKANPKQKLNLKKEIGKTQILNQGDVSSKCNTKLGKKSAKQLQPKKDKKTDKNSKKVAKGGKGQRKK